jgi:hypothetical protein
MLHSTEFSPNKLICNIAKSEVPSMQHSTEKQIRAITVQLSAESRLSAMQDSAESTQFSEYLHEIEGKLKFKHSLGFLSED